MDKYLSRLDALGPHRADCRPRHERQHRRDLQRMLSTCKTRLTNGWVRTWRASSCPSPARMWCTTARWAHMPRFYLPPGHDVAALAAHRRPGSGMNKVLTRDPLAQKIAARSRWRHRRRERSACGDWHPAPTGTIFRALPTAPVTRWHFRTDGAARLNRRVEGLSPGRRFAELRCL